MARRHLVRRRQRMLTLMPSYWWMTKRRWISTSHSDVCVLAGYKFREAGWAEATP